MKSTNKPDKDDEWKEISLDETAVWDRKEPIEGELISVKDNVGPNSAMMYTLKTKDGTVSIWGSTVLDNKFEHVPVGVIVRIEPQGLVKSEASGRSYQDYKVFFKDTKTEKDEQSGYFEGEEETTDEMPPDFLSES